jgi:uncharacterized protein YebE (UPF0316 family)
VRGYVSLSMVLGFFEVGIWVVAIAQVIARINESWLMVVAYAGGFAVGNGVGIVLERRIALGTAVIRLISSGEGRRIARALRELGWKVTTFRGQGASGPVVLVYVAGPRRAVSRIIATARTVDPDLFYVVEPAHESGQGLSTRMRSVPHATGWRAVFKKK